MGRPAGEVAADGNVELPDLVELETLDEILAAMDLLGICNPDDPQSLAEAMTSPAAKDWKAAMKEEFDVLRDSEVYKLMPHSAVPAG